MKNKPTQERLICPVCQETTGQMRNGANRSGTQTYRCRHCNKFYTPEPKQKAYSEETRSLAIKMFYSGVSGRGVGKVLRMSKANVYNWIKKNGANP